MAASRRKSSIKWFENCPLGASLIQLNKVMFKRLFICESRFRLNWALQISFSERVWRRKKIKRLVQIRNKMIREITERRGHHLVAAYSVN